MANDNSKPRRVERDARLKWVPLGKMRVSPNAQREQRQARVDALVANLDLEQLGLPTVSERDGWFWIIDGQHRVAALKEYGFDDDTTIQCWTYTGLTEDEEAEKFLKLNDVLTVDAYSKFRVAVQAGREVECDIDRIVRSQELRISRDKIPGAISAVGTLRRIYSRGGPITLRRTVAIVRDAYGDPGLESAVLDGVGLLCGRYNGEVNDAALIQRLSGTKGGVNALLGRAEQLRQRFGAQKAHCVAAAAVEIYNRGKGGKKIPSWWRDDLKGAA